MTAFGVIPRHPGPQPEPLGWVVARIGRDGRATLTGASVYDLREDADHTAAQCQAIASSALTIAVCEVVPVPP